MNKITYDINKLIAESLACYNKKMYLSSLMLALTLPDICSKILNTHKKSTRHNYVNWCNKWMSKFMSSIIPSFICSYKDKFGEMIYQLRCGLFHNVENDVVANITSRFYTVSNFSFYVNDNNDFLDPSFIVKHEQISEYIKEYKNNYDIKINLGYLIVSLIQSTISFLKSNNIDVSLLPKFEVNTLQERCKD